MGNQACDQACSHLLAFAVPSQDFQTINNNHQPYTMLVEGKGNIGIRLGGLQAVLPNPRRQRRMQGIEDVVKSIMQPVVNPLAHPQVNPSPPPDQGAPL